MASESVQMLVILTPKPGKINDVRISFRPMYLTLNSVANGSS
jgi:hypothetical protein